MISFVIVESAGTDKVLKPPKPPGKSSFTIVTSGSKEEPLKDKLICLIFEQFLRKKNDVFIFS